MRLRKFQVQDFQSFSDSGEIDFADGFNLIIGQNNAGKSALLRAMLPAIPDDRHRTPAAWESFRLRRPKTTFGIEVSGSELRDSVLRIGGSHFIPIRENEPREIQGVMEEFFDRETLLLSVSRMPGESFTTSDYPSHGLFVETPGARRACIMATPVEGSVRADLQYRNEDSVAALLWDGWLREMFYFTAERMTVGEAAPGHAERLTSNAANLPNVLHTLSNERGDVFRRIIGQLRDVFSTVGNVSVRTRPENHNLEIRVWPTQAMERVELGFPLNSSGTGVAQVIAILTAMVTADKAVIIIDEINSFLHPAAVKALLRILQTEYSQHQYIISTHAPEVIAFSNPKTIHLVKRDGYESQVVRLDTEKVGEFREVAEHLGVSMADVFAADRIIWVEGPSEELSFPYLYQQFGGEPLPRGTAFTSVAATGDLNRKRDRQIVYEVYNRLSSAAATLVVSVMFSFDSEDLTDAEKRDMVRDARGRLLFLPRRHIECYAVDPTAVTNMIIAKDPESEGVVTAEVVAAKFAELAASRRFAIPEWNGEITNENWLSKVDAANLIARATAELSDQRASFQKKEDTLGLFQDILLRDPAPLRPLYEYVRSLVQAVAIDR